MVKYCKSCALANLKILKCRRFGHDINPNEDFCSKHCNEIPVCAICGQEMLKENSILNFKNGDHIRIICQKCNELLSSCTLCRHGQKCAYDDDPSPIPKLIQKQIRQGPMISVTQEINPERIKITCKNGCSCYSDEFDCMRQFSYCQNLEHIWSNESNESQ